MSPDQLTQLRRQSALLQLEAASREAGLPLATVVQGVQLAGHNVGADEVAKDLDYLLDKGLIRTSRAALSAACTRYHLTAAGVDYLKLSLSSASTARAMFEDHLARLRRARELAELVAATGEEGAPVTGSLAAMAQAELFDELAKPDPERDMLKVAKAVNLLAGAQARTEAAGHARAEAARKQADWEARQAEIASACEDARGQGGLTDATLKRIEEAAGLL